MATHERFDQLMSDWLEEAAPAGLPARTLDATFERTRGSRQQVDWRARLARLPRSAPALAGAGAILVALALAPNFAAVISPPPSVDLGIFEPVEGKIVYGSERRIFGIEDGIWAVDPTSSDPATPVRLTAAPGTPLGWSRDGTRLLIQKGDENLFILHADGSETQVTEQLTGISGIRGSGRPSGATISPDGSRVVFAGMRGIGPSCHRGALFAVAADGGPAELLWESQAADDGGIVRDPTFSPDGTQIAFVDGYCDSDHSVWVMNADGSNAHQIVTGEDTPLGGTHVHGLAWSPAGDRIAIKIDQGIFTFAPDGTDFTPVTTAAATDPSLEPFWSPDGSRIAYTTGCGFEDADGLVHECSLAIADADGSNEQTFGYGLSGPWHPGAASPPVEPTEPPAPPSAEPSTPTSGGMWPQSTIEEVREAQALADADDPDYAWQRDGILGTPGRIGQHHPGTSRFLDRFLEEKLGWEAYLWDEAFAHAGDQVDGDVVYVRCAPGGSDTLYPIDLDDPGCAPTIDGSRYETVKINVARLDRDEASGIWVVTGWEMIEPFERAAPPSDAEITASLGAFLQARIEGEGAEAFVDFAADDPFVEDRVNLEIPLLYATSTGAPYVRSEFELVDGPVSPSGRLLFEVRLFTENDETVVEQLFALERDETRGLRLVFDFRALGPDATRPPAASENGKPVPLEYGFLDGLVTYQATYPLEPSEDGYRGPDRLAIDGVLPNDSASRKVLTMLADPRPIEPDCSEGAAPADAEALARNIQADPDFEATEPVAVTIGGTRALQMDVVPRAPNPCFKLLKDAPFQIGSNRARLYLLDLPEGSEARILAIVTITDDDSFATVVAAAAAIVDSIEIHAP